MSCERRMSVWWMESSDDLFTRAFRAKRELHCMFLGKKVTSKHGTTIFFRHYNLFQGKFKEKLAPGHPKILLKSK